MPDFFAYTDGACSGNPGPGGWGVLLQAKDGETVLIRQADIEYDDVWIGGGDGRLGGGGVFTLEDDLEIVLQLQHGSECLADDGMVIDEQQAERAEDGHLRGWASSYKRCHGAETHVKSRRLVPGGLPRKRRFRFRCGW